MTGGGALRTEPVPRPGEAPAAAIERIEAASELLSTPCGDGEMVWRRWGALDAVARPYLEEREIFVHALRSDAGFHVIPDVGHWVAYEAPEPFNVLLGRLLADASRAG